MLTLEETGWWGCGETQHYLSASVNLKLFQNKTQKKKTLKVKK